MKLVCALVVLAACDLQPAPKQAPPPPAPARGSAVIEASPSTAAGSGSAALPRPAPAPAIQPTAECEQAGIKYAELLVNSAEPSQKPTLERERADIVRGTEEACTTQHWSAPAIACMAQAKTDNDARACLDKFPPPGAPKPSQPQHPPRD